jgi:hypothetical protein
MANASRVTQMTQQAELFQVESKRQNPFEKTSGKEKCLRNI